MNNSADRRIRAQGLMVAFIAGCACIANVEVLPCRKRVAALSIVAQLGGSPLRMNRDLKQAQAAGSMGIAHRRPSASGQFPSSPPVRPFSICERMLSCA